nr:unnamed protein product [Spirometra erinaceieuropaei]
MQCDPPLLHSCQRIAIIWKFLTPATMQEGTRLVGLLRAEEPALTSIRTDTLESQTSEQSFFLNSDLFI